jgi:hypothetical protein
LYYSSKKETQHIFSKRDNKTVKKTGAEIGLLPVVTPNPVVYTAVVAVDS